MGALIPPHSIRPYSTAFPGIVKDIPQLRGDISPLVWQPNRALGHDGLFLFSFYAVQYLFCTFLVMKFY